MRCRPGGTSGHYDYPFRGVSWYEAAAHAESAGKSLLSLHHWQKAALSGCHQRFSLEIGFRILAVDIHRHDGQDVAAVRFHVGIAENVGVSPDIEIEHDPEAVRAGHDLQLEREVQEILPELAKNPPKKLTRPTYPKYHTVK